LAGISAELIADIPNTTLILNVGTAAEFHKALADLRSLGVHPLIFANIQVADTATPLFHNMLEKYTVYGRWAPDWQLWGWREGTIGARLELWRSSRSAGSSALQKET
jgi:hypothetical protein